MAQNLVDFEAAAQKVLAAYDVPGVIVAVARDGEPVSFQPFGYRDREQQLELDKDTVFGIGSVTKSFTAVAIMQLEEAGLLSVDDPVVKHLPEFRLANTDVSGITIHHLLTHSAGLPPLGTLYAAMLDSIREDPDTPKEPFEKLEPIRTYGEFFEFVAAQDVKLLGEPGRYFSYSNDGFAVLGAVVEKVSGKPYETFVEENILQPAGMLNSGFDHRVLQERTNVAMIYGVREDGEEVYASPTWWESKVMSAAGFLKSTASDMLRYAELFRTGGLVGDVRLLSEDSVTQILTPHVECGPDWFYGYGMMITPDFHGVLVAEHGGNIKGASAYLTVIPEHALTSVMLSNLVTTPCGDVLRDALNLEMGLPLGTKRVDLTPRPTDGVDLQEYAGQYVSEEGAAVTFRVEDNALVAEFQGKTYPVSAVGEADTFTFRVKEMDLTHKFLRDASDEVNAVHLGFRVIRKVPAAEPSAAEDSGEFAAGV
ncbi:serine hydrolase domain-containing protein [Alicyclobacillus ferrooxydans]|uniref:Beta-lactamase-related domain-containing protein n=1 Tax=Alicyclobacillus ferrooxydans TaxID=471514 RepID=A0A0P9ENR0_9BACL|nr:serine hydrolase domain-containing protein [Alicyclobacillus ferrooxydans]KPV45097.1 hypothetical protein AN477_03650 [Alicyclobacillus ferrooxydans]